jgi:hypothetical protein
MTTSYQCYLYKIFPIFYGYYWKDIVVRKNRAMFLLCLSFSCHTYSLHRLSSLMHRVQKQMRSQREVSTYLAVYEFQSYAVPKDRLAAVLHLHLLSSCRMHQAEGPETKNLVLRIIPQWTFLKWSKIWYALSKVRRCLRHNLCSQRYGSKSLVRSTGSEVWHF